MSFWRPDIYWTDRLRWHERICVGAWWLGQAAFTVCVAASICLAATSAYGPLSHSSNVRILESAAVILLAGVVILLGTRWTLGLVARPAEPR